MKMAVGIDCGTSFLKIALKLPSLSRELKELLEERGFGGFPYRSGGDEFYLLSPRVVHGDPAGVVSHILAPLIEVLQEEGFQVIGAATGRLGKRISQLTGLPYENDFRCILRAVERFHPEVRTLFEMGAETSKFIRFAERDGKLQILEYGMNGECAAGTGSFIDQQAARMRIDVRDIGEMTRNLTRSASIAGRCSVFAKSDMIHAQQKGYTPEEIMKGLSEAVARNFKSAVVRGRAIEPPVLFVGGVSLNEAVARSLREVFELDEREFSSSPVGVHLPALGALLAAGEEGKWQTSGRGERKSSGQARFPFHPPLSRDGVVFLRDEVESVSTDANYTGGAYLGIDIGSVSTNFALLDEEGRVLDEVYVRTEGRPVQVVRDNLRRLGEKWEGRVKILAVGTTGSGRELVGELVGADVVIDEITAHKTGALMVAEKYFGSGVDTIFEIGGQDSKFISLREGVVVDFAMNDACAAGTGSFLEEQAEKLGIDVKKDFAPLAFSSRTPLRLGERCTVFMEQDISSYMKRGARQEDLVAGLAYAIVFNYLNRVVRGRKIGERIYFQGGTAYNDAVAAAFSCVLGRQVVVPPHNGVMGAIGAALVAREKRQVLRQESRFRGFDLSLVPIETRELSCRGCSNECEVKEITVAGEKTYWGDKCSEKFRRPAKVPREPVAEDLIQAKNALLQEALDELEGKGKLTAAVPRTMYFYERFPFWAGFFRELGIGIVATPRTNRKIAEEGFEISVAEPCFPIQAALGHISYMVRELGDADFFFVPNVINAEATGDSAESFYCPWGQTLPFVARSNPRLNGYLTEKLLAPTVRFRDGIRLLAEDLHGALRRFGVTKRRVLDAVQAGYEEMKRFERIIREKGRNLVEAVKARGAEAVLLLGRPYNIYDREMNINIPGKIREHYGLDVLPFDFVPDLESVDIGPVHGNMFWNLGRKILKAARWARERENYSVIYVTNFKCGPDSFVRHFVEKALGRPFLTLTFDGHGNDAGFMTRVEAYLDSRGVIRWWKRRDYERV